MKTLILLCGCLIASSSLAQVFDVPTVELGSIADFSAPEPTLSDPIDDINPCYRCFPNPVPEPSTYGIAFAATLFGLALYRQSHRNTKKVLH